MSGRLPFVPLLVLALALPATAQELSCGTNAAVIRRDEQIARWSVARKARLQSKGLLPSAQAAEIRDNVVILPTDELMAPFSRRIDLQSRTIDFVRKDDATFTATVGALNADAEYGTKLTLPNPDSHALVTINAFVFPFRGESHQTLYVSGRNGIFFEPPRVVEFEQFGDLELVAQRQPVIAPLLTTEASQGRAASAFVRQGADFVTVTWISTTYEVQAKLFKSGDIRFSYRSANPEDLLSGGILITSGDESWRSARTTLGSATDATGDVRPGLPAAFAPMLDVTSVAVNRIAGSDLIEVRVRVAAPIDLSLTNTQFEYRVSLGGDSLTYVANAQDSYYYTPLWGYIHRSHGARIEGDTVVMTVLQDDYPSLLGLVGVSAHTSYGAQPADSLQLAADVPEPASRVRRDLSSLSGTDVTGPIVESFTVPVLSVYAVWNDLRARYSLDPEEWDAVAVYQNFFTDIIYYAGAYSTVGNAGVDGIGTTFPISSGLPREPALLHMNKVDYGVNLTADSASHVVMHELGHRWLLHVAIREGNVNTYALNPISAHPAQYVHTSAPYRVITDADSSVMGGAAFTDQGNGTFRSPLYGSYSYSFLDLYLMGLMPPSEVQPWYYIANSNPALGGAYYPPPNRTFGGVRRDVTIQQVIDANGPRNPAWPNTQRQFKVLVVLLTDEAHPASNADLASIARYRRLLESNFRLATGNRAEVSTMFPIPVAGPRRRAAK